MDNQREDNKLNITLVYEVKKHPCLYDRTDTNYYKHNKIETWKQIAQVMNIPAVDCRRKWKLVRDVYIKHRKKRDIANRKPCYLDNHMAFLDPHCLKAVRKVEANKRIRSGTQSTSSQDNSNKKEKYIKVSSDESQDSDFNSTKRKKMRLSKKNACAKKSNSKVKSLLEDLAFDLRLMDQEQFNVFKRKVLTIVDDVMESS